VFTVTRDVWDSADDAKTFLHIALNHPNGYYSWKRKPESVRRIEDARLLAHIKQSWLKSGTMYGLRPSRNFAAKGRAGMCSFALVGAVAGV